MKNVLIISSSPKEKSNSNELCLYFQKGAIEAGHNVELIRLKDKKINYCIACHSCESTGTCFQKDDMQELQQKICNIVSYVLWLYEKKLISERTKNELLKRCGD